MGKKRRRKEDGPLPEQPLTSSSDFSDAESVISHKVVNKGKYDIYKVPGYTRCYPEDSNKSEFIVLLSHTADNTIFSDRDRMSLSKKLREHGVSGVMHLKTINKYKVGITFDLPNNANMFLKNKKLLEELLLKATIPARDTEITGVLRSVPVGMSNKDIFSLIGSSKNVIQVRRFMRRVRDEVGTTFVPTQTVAVTFASTNLPEYIYLDSWRHEVNIYIPPIKQCLKCMRYNHIAKFCRNNVVCSICSENHSFKDCKVDSKNAKCVNCKGNHIAIASVCPLKKQKIEENKIKSNSVRYSELFDAKSFPVLNARTLDTQVKNLMKSDIFMNILIETSKNCCKQRGSHQ